MKTYKMNIAANMRIMNCQSIARSDLQSARLIYSELTHMTNTLPARNQNARLLISQNLDQVTYRGKSRLDSQHRILSA